MLALLALVMSALLGAVVGVALSLGVMRWIDRRRRRLDQRTTGRRPGVDLAAGYLPPGEVPAIRLPARPDSPGNRPYLN